MSNLILPEYDNFLERVETGLSKKLDLTKIPEWICKNTRDPRNKRLRWSFADHEFQMGILSEAAAHVVVRKCSQVGLSEASVRLTLAVCYMRDLTGIYVLPTKAFVQKFSPDRIDRVVDNSPTLSTHKSKEHYNVGLKRIGDMSLYVVGSFSPGDAISVPAQFLVRDEYDFCKQSVLTTFDSRLGHNKEGEDFRRDFDAIVARYGWDYNGGRDWRTRVIYETNLNTSYAAGRWEQLQAAPFWMYEHSDWVENPRHQHKAWDGMVLARDDPWWQTHYPPNGWGCQCKVIGLWPRDLARMGKSGPDRAPEVTWVERVIGKYSPGGPRVVSVPSGIDPGFEYAPGRDRWRKYREEA